MVRSFSLKHISKCSKKPAPAKEERVVYGLPLQYHHGDFQVERPVLAFSLQADWCFCFPGLYLAAYSLAFGFLALA